MIRNMLNNLKIFAVKHDIQDAKDLAKEYFLTDDKTHGDWDVLFPSYQRALIKISTAALQELETGELIPKK